MNKLFLAIAAFCLVSCSSSRYFIVRHAEKETSTMTADVPLSDLGRQRADALRMVLADEKISEIYSTNYIRTKSTVQPLADALQLPVKIYGPMDTAFFKQLRNSKNNILITGHSNTVDDIVNTLLGYKKLNDLADNQYGDLFIVKKKGNKFSLELKKF